MKSSDQQKMKPGHLYLVDQAIKQGKVDIPLAETIWTDAMLFGIDSIDSMRKELVMFFELLNLERSGRITRDQYRNRFMRWEALLAELFAREEQLMDDFQVSSEDLMAHVDDHLRLESMFSQAYVDYAENAREPNNDLYTVARPLIARHLQTVDAKLAGYRRSRPF